MNPLIWVFIILMTLDALREMAGGRRFVCFGMVINVGLSRQ
ncbi:KPN_01571 family protein [Escherichia albertii]